MPEHTNNEHNERHAEQGHRQGSRPQGDGRRRGSAGSYGHKGHRDDRRNSSGHGHDDRRRSSVRSGKDDRRHSSNHAGNNERRNEEEAREPKGYAGELHARRRPNNADSLVTPARMTAFKLVKMVQEESISVHEAGRRLLPHAKLSAEDSSFAQLLATGVISTFGTLNMILNRILRNPDDVKPDVRLALCVSTYEIVFLKKQAHAAVDQGVELVRAIAPRATKLANYVLRRTNEFKKALPAFGEGTIEDDSIVAGFPAWMVRSLVETRGEVWTRDFLAHSGEQTLVKGGAPLWFTFNENRVDGAAALQSLVERGVDAAPETLALPKQTSVFRLKNRKDVSEPLFAGLLKEGALVVSDYSAQAITALSLPSQKPERFLEIGAGRGTKTLMLQSMAKHAYGSQMNLTAVEVSPHKSSILDARCKRAHVNAEVVTADATDLGGVDGRFDAILLDAPCSGSGTMRRHPEIKWRITEEDVKAISRLELALLKEAAGKLADGGRLTYATCSVFKRENEDVIEAFLASDEGAEFEIESLGGKAKYFFAKPTVGGPDVHFACILRRKAQ